MKTTIEVRVIRTHGKSTLTSVAAGLLSTVSFASVSIPTQTQRAKLVQKAVRKRIRRNITLR